MSQNKTIYSFDIEKTICFVTRNDKVFQNDERHEFLKDESLSNLLARVKKWMEVINAECAGEDGLCYLIDNPDLTLYCCFSSSEGQFTAHEKYLIRRAMR